MIDKYVNGEELKRLLSTLVVILTAIAIGGLFAMILVPGLRNANRPETPTPVNPAVGEPGWLDPAEFPPERGRVIPPVDPQTLIAASSELTARGKDLFATNCVPCHGEQGLGDGAAAVTMNPRPRNFSSPDGWKSGYTLPAIYRTISTGSPGTSMATFDYLSRKDRMALAHYVQSLGAFPHGSGNPGALEALSKELAAPGEKTPNKIPVSTAMARLEQEFTAARPLAVTPDDHTPGAEIFRRVVQDPIRAAQALAASGEWRKGPSELADGILHAAPGNGFSANVAALTADEWKSLHDALMKLAPR